MMSSLSEILACPRCDAKPLISAVNGYTCKSCKTEFPLLDGIPFLFPEPGFSLAEWRERLNRLIVQFDYEATQLDQELAQPKLFKPTQQRLRHLADSYRDHVLRLKKILQPLDISSLQASFDTYLALRTHLPQRQGLTTYYANLHRDWCWGDDENSLSAKEVISSIQDGQHKRILVLGAGGGRLAYDIHQALKPELTVALDINPLLLFVANRITQGETVELYEFPIAPRAIEDHAILRTLGVGEPVAKGFHYILADALHAPFAPAGFDLVVTPWLLDIIPEDLRSFAPRVNRLLSVNGKWINFGSLAFSHEKLASCYSLEEVRLIFEESGFAEFQAKETALPYMQSPASRHARIEHVLTINATKMRKAKKPTRYRALPDWIVKGEDPVPLLQSFQTQAIATRIHAFIMAMIDGKRSIRDMALMLEQQKLMPFHEAEPAVRSFLTKMYEEKLRMPNF